MKSLKKPIFIVAAICLISVIIWRNQTNRTKEYKSEQFLMDTLISIKVYGNDPENMQKAVNSSFAEMRRIAELTNWFPEKVSAECNGSDVCKINQNAGKTAIAIHPETFEILKNSLHYSKISNGAFDVTIGSLIDLWGFGGKSPHLPAPDEIRTVLTNVDQNSLILDESAKTAFLRKKGVKLDLGAVVKGYATERAAKILHQYGIEKAIIDAGGNIRVIGVNSSNEPWKIGVKDPRNSEAVVAVLKLKDESAVTSGDYYRYFEENGIRYHHILDPRTGYPPHHTLSATVVTKDAGLADNLSTLCFVLKPKEAVAFAQAIPGVELMLVTADRKIMHTQGLSGKIKISENSGYIYDQGR